MSTKPKSAAPRTKSRASRSSKPRSDGGMSSAKASSFPDPASFPRTARGRRPYFFDDPNVDKLLAMIMALAGEVSVLRERLDTHERLAANSTWPSATKVEDYAAPRDVTDAREARRAEFISRILRIVSDDVEQMSGSDAEQEYRSQIRHVSQTGGDKAQT